MARWCRVVGDRVMEVVGDRAMEVVGGRVMEVVGGRVMEVVGGRVIRAVWCQPIGKMVCLAEVRRVGRWHLAGGWGRGLRVGVRVGVSLLQRPRLLA
jgi:hypothetical protein